MIPKRQQIKKRDWNQMYLANPRQVIFGVDPGLRSTGIAVIERTGRAKPKALHLQVIETKPTPKKERRTLRVTTDDQRRYKEIYTALDILCKEYEPFAMGVEAYLIGQQAASSAWKTAVIYGGVLYFAYSRNMFVAPFLPLDLKRRFVGKQGASKRDVALGMFPLISNLETLVKKVPKTKQEHVVDAAGHAFLVLEEVDKTREMLGI